MADQQQEIDRHLQEVERLLRRIELEEVTRASRRSRANPSGRKRYGIGDARCDARHALAQVLSARQKLSGAAAFLRPDGVEGRPDSPQKDGWSEGPEVQCGLCQSIRNMGDGCDRENCPCSKKRSGNG